MLMNANVSMNIIKYNAFHSLSLFHICRNI